MGFKGLPKVDIRQLRQFSWRSRSSSPEGREANDPLIDPEKQNYSDSPPSSPRLSPIELGPAKPRKSLCNRCLHLLLWSFLIALFFWAAGALFYTSKKFETHLQLLTLHEGEADIVHWHTQPDHPDAGFFPFENSSKWTVTVPQSEDFPLSPATLQDVCLHCAAMPFKLHEDEEHVGHSPYYYNDPDYMQVSEAIAKKILPPSFSPHSDSVVEGTQDPRNNGNEDNIDPETGRCKRSLTFVMQSPDPGFGPVLMSLWSAYGLAQREKRAFFIDDRNWAYGSWSTFFSPPPMPSCKPPPEVERVPCPHQADHLLVGTATAAWTFGHAFEEEFEDAHKMEVQRQVNIFGLMRIGYEALFHLAPDDQEFVQNRVKELNTLTGSGITVGIHIRHGDKHPYLQEFTKTYIPPENYVVAANHELFRTFNSSTEKDSDDGAKIASSRMVVASDDADVYTIWEAGDIFRAQDRVVLTTPSASQISGTAATLPLAFDGGFFASRFAEITGSMGWFTTDPAVEYKALLGRSYLLDLAVLGETDRIVCTTSSIGCRLLAVMMGWENAIDNKRWINVDGDWDWQGV